MHSIGSQVRDDVLRLDHIPPLSGTASELLQVANDPDLDAKILSAILERDPQLTARVLGLANSAFFGQARPVQSLEEAIIRVLGLNVVRNLALSMALAGSFDVSRCPAYDMQRYWLIALGSAELSRRLARAQGQPERVHLDMAYLCGLLHSLGEIALVHLRPDLVCAAIHDHRDTPDSDLITLQRQHLGLDSWQAGEWLAFRWQLPEPVTDTIGYFATGVAQGPYGTLVALARDWMVANLEGRPPVADDECLAAATADFSGKLDELRALACSMV
jgi:HD-like signal output (HDOD) protein